MKRKIIISKRLIESINLNEIFPYIIGKSKEEFLNNREHYKLLAYLSSQFNNSYFTDLGTWHGASATALGANKTNTIFSFDIKSREIQCKEHGYNNENIPFFENIDFVVTKDFFRYSDLILKSDLIVLDIDHSGEMEKKFLDFLIKWNYNGILIMDDIDCVYFQELKKIYDSISIEKFNLTNVGHWSGTGLVNFNKDLEIIIE